MNYIEKKNNEKTILKYHLLAIIPLLLYAFYKNGVLLYLNDVINFFDMFMPLIYCVGFSLIIVILKKIFKKKFCINDFYYFTCVLFLPYTYNYLLVFILFGLFYMLSFTKFKLPYNIIFLIAIYLILGSNLTFLNVLEATKSFNYTLLDLIIGKGESYLMTSSLLCSLFAFIYLSLKPYYKTLIVISFMVFYILLTITYGHFFNYDFTNIFGIFCAMSILGCSFTFTPITKLSMISYSLCTAILCVIFSYFFGYYIGIFISILLVQIMSNIDVRKIFTK